MRKKKSVLVVLAAVVIFSEVPSGDSLSNKYRPDAMAWHEVIKKQKPPDTPWPDSW